MYDVNFTEKICVCYTCCGPTYRKSALQQLTTAYPDADNVFYCILTDDKSYFKDVKIKNLIVNELKDFYPEYPYLEKYEPFLESTDENDYAHKFVTQHYLFPYSTMRFHLIQAKSVNCSNVALLSTDSTLVLSAISDDLLSTKNKIYNQLTHWILQPSDIRINSVNEILKRKYNLSCVDDVMIHDGACKFFVFKDVYFMGTFFQMWHDVVTTLYEENTIRHHYGSYVVHDEHILAPINQVLNITEPENFAINGTILSVQHNAQTERFWTV